jgi:hypothetical protein
MKIVLWSLPTIRTYYDVVDAVNWCFDNIGPPNERWKYGKDEPEFLCGSIISSPHEIDFIEFFHDADAMMFKLRF